MLRTFLTSFCLIILMVSCGKKTLFKKIGSAGSGIHFANTINESDSVNVLDFENVYNGGGVGAGDFNNDGLQDLYFTGNLVSHKLYLNKGGLSFSDITDKAGVSGSGRWGRGVAVVDINNDGWDDLYVCASVAKAGKERQNQLYINKGLDRDGIPHFEDKAADYGLNDTTHSTMAAFFDYDNDGDLDVYILVNEIVKDDYPNRFRPRLLKGEHPSTGRLYRNDWNDTLRHAYFTNVSQEAGVTIEGYGHGIAVTDINLDGWKDLYISNDYLSNNILYINNGNGTFTDQVGIYFKHTSANAMGNDVIDINNDGLQDVIELDMNPEDNYRKKMMMNANSYQTFTNSDYFNYQYQYVRNTLQLNQGPRRTGGDSIGSPVFSDISFFAGVSETDWSWTPLVTDFDNDGFRDLIITNGFPRDVTDHDFVAFRNEAFAVASKKQLLEQIPAVKVHNYAFKNKGDLTFSNESFSWGFHDPSFSNGAVYADLDNDGDMDVVINNINDEASVYENTLMDDNLDQQRFLGIKLEGDAKNRGAFGTWIELYYQGQKQVYEQTPYRGYLSSVQKNPHFGLGKITSVDSVVVKWPDGRMQRLKQVATNQTITVQYRHANEFYSWQKNASIYDPLLTDITDSLQIDFVHEERDFVDFNIQKLLPHKFSEYGPALAAGDVNGDGLDDFIAGGSFSVSPTVLLQQKDGSFLQQPVFPEASIHTKRWEDAGMVLFDADGDKDLDLYTASGGYENEPGTPAYADQFYLNDGGGRFALAKGSIPENHTSKSCVRAADYDNDGDMDLFLGGRVEPWNYPKPVSCFIYQNNSKNGKISFTDVTTTVASSLKNIGLTCDAVWTDFNNDGWQDLMLAGEWMPLTFLKNNKGIFENITSAAGTAGKTGWWTSLQPGDFDNDGDMDYIAGNLGLNSFFRASEAYPVRIYAKDFDNNNSYDAVPTLYLPTSQKNPERKEYVAHVRDDMTKQMIAFKSKFQNYNSYASATFHQMFTAEELKDALMLKANYFSNSFVRNNGNGTFDILPLPSAAQFSCINGMLAEDFNNDGNLDLLVNGNDYGTEVTVGRYDACNGLLLLGDGKGGFNALPYVQSGFFEPGNGKAAVKLTNKNGKTLVATSQNRGPVKVYEAKQLGRAIVPQTAEVAAIVTLRDNRIQRHEFSYGSSFMSQSTRVLNIPVGTRSIVMINNKGKRRTVPLTEINVVAQGRNPTK